MVDHRRSGPRSARALCPVLVGRQAEVEMLATFLGRTAAADGSTVVLRGEAGIGKSRLVREALALAGASPARLVGRCVPHGQAPYRPLTEALFPAARAGGLPNRPELRAFRHALGTVVPDWRGEGDTQEHSPVLVGEGILRLARWLGGDTGAVLVVEDLHWADPDTVAVLEYLADNVAGQPVSLLLTARPLPGEASDLVARLEVRAAAHVVDLHPLDDRTVAAMVGACLGTPVADLSAEVVAAVVARSEGLPLLVEELLSVPAAGLSDAVPAAGLSAAAPAAQLSAAVPAGLSDAVPASFADAVARRVASLPGEAARVVAGAAVLGRHFDWRLLPAVTGVEPDAVTDALEAAVAVQLVMVGADGTFSFRHALTRDAVLAGLLPPTRVALAQRAASTLTDGADPDAVDPLLAAELWWQAGDPGAAVAGLLSAGRRAIARGDLVTAQRLLERAWAEAPTDDDQRGAVAGALAEALARAARLDEALEVGAEALTLLQRTGAPPVRRAQLHLALARAADGATRWALAEAQLALARHAADEAGDAEVPVAADALAAHVALGRHRPDEAERLARAAVAAATGAARAEVACEALEVLGRRERPRDLDRAAVHFAEAADIARRNGLALSSVRALHELGTIDMLQRGADERLLEARELAYRAGALSVAATLELQLIGLYAFTFRLDEATEAAQRALELTETLDLEQVHVAALLQLAFVHAIAGRVDDMEAAVAGALVRAGDDPEAHALAWGHARAMASLWAEDRAEARHHLDRALPWTRQLSGVPGCYAALGLLVAVVEGAGPEALAEHATLGVPAIPLNRGIAELAAAVVEGRAGSVERAGARAAEAEDLLLAGHTDGFRLLALRLAAEAAVADGWGEPARWLDEALAFFDASGHVRVALACRDLLRRAGVRAPRVGEERLPERLRVAGVTNREADVLRLLGQRLTNRDIADRLFLSPRTVEKHVERLLAKTGSGSRHELGRLARDLLGRS